MGGNPQAPETMMVEPDWPAPDSVRTLITTRAGGNSAAPYGSLNLGFHVEDNAATVANNWQSLVAQHNLPDTPVLLNQVHGSDVVQLPNLAPITADGAFTRQPGQTCCILTADCLPVLLCDRTGTQVAALHAGWRGLAANILGKGIATFSDPSQIMAYLGPAICSDCFEVGKDVRQAFIRAAADWGRGVDAQVIDACFKQVDESHWLADLYQLARYCLEAQGVTAIYGGEYCTFHQPENFFSYRRDGLTGRIASVIWLAE